MPKRGRGRPPKAQSAKYLFKNSTDLKYEDIYDVNERRESYNTSLLKSESSSPKQLQLGNGGITYGESLMKFCKDLGPTARKIAHRKLLGQRLNYQAPHLLEPFLDVSSFHGSARNTKSNQLSQPLITFGATADNKGKTIMVDDGSKSNFNKWDAGENLEFLLGKQKTGVKICNRYQENVSLTGGNGSSENQDFFRKNLGHGPVGNSSVYPSTYVQPSTKVSSSFLGNLDDGVSSIPWVPPPALQKRWLPPPETKNPVINDGFWRDQELQLALASYMHMRNQNSKAWFGNSLPQNQNMIDNDASQPQLWSQMAMFGSAPKQDSFSFGI